jgi:hypothetical protein
VAVAFDVAGGGSGTSSSTTYNWTHTVGGGVTNGAILVGVATDASADGALTTTVTIGGTTATSLGKIHCDNTTQGYLQVFGLATGSTTGSVAIATTVSGGTPTDINGGSLSFSGVNQTTPFINTLTSPAVNNGWGSGTTPSGTTPGATTSGNLVAGFCANGSAIASATSPSTSQFIDNFKTTGDFAAGCSAGATSAATGSAVTMAWTVTSDFWAVLVTEVQAAAPTSAPQIPPQPGSKQWQRRHHRHQQIISAPQQLITLDASTPAAVDNVSSVSTTATTASFSPPANSMVVVAVDVGLLSSNATMTMTLADSLSNSYTAGPNIWAFSNNGVWYFTHYYSSAPGSITLTATRSFAGQGLFSVKTMVLNGANSNQSGAAAPSATSGNNATLESSITPTQLSSWCFATTSSNALAGTAAGLTEDHNFHDGTNGALATLGHVNTSSLSPETIGWTATASVFWAWAGLEILPASPGGGLTVSAGLATATGTALDSSGGMAVGITSTLATGTGTSLAPAVGLTPGLATGVSDTGQYGGGPSGIALDASTPTAGYSSSFAHTPLWTSGEVWGANPPTFTPPAKSLVVVMANIGFGSGAAGTFTVTDGSNTYTNSATISNTTATTAVLIAQFYYTTSPGAITVTMSNSNTTINKDYFLFVQVLTGAAASQTGAASSAISSGATTSFAVNNSLTPTQTGSWVYVIGNNGGSTTGAAVTGTTTALTDSGGHLASGGYFSDASNSVDQFTWGKYSANPTTSLSALTLGWTYSGGTAGANTWAALEILPDLTAGAGTSVAIGITPALATGTGGAGNITVLSPGISAGLATGTGTAFGISIVINAGLATGTGTAFAPGIGITAGLATATGTALGASYSITPALATGTGAALAPGVGIIPGLASGVGAANAPNIGFTPGLATGAGAAPGISQAVNAGLATGTGNAFAPAVGLTPALATATGTASGISIRINAGLATGTGAALAPAVGLTPGLATGTGNAGGISIRVNAGLATGTGTAGNITVQAPGISAGLATATGTAGGISIVVNAGLATGTGTAGSISIRVNAGLATATGTAQPVAEATFSFFAGQTGPSSPNAYTGPYIAALSFKATSSGTWFYSYRYWCPPGGDTGSQKFALWIATSSTTGNLISGSVINSGTLTTGWNVVTLPTPLPLTSGVTYVACTGWTVVNGFPYTGFQFGSGNPYSSGITSGPIFAFADGTSGGSPGEPNGLPQSVFSTTSADPSTSFPTQGFDSNYLWIDVAVSTGAPPVSLAGLATGTGSALPPAVGITAGLATATGSALAPAVGITAGLATGTGTAFAPTVPRTPGLATGTGTASGISVRVNAGLATGTGSALAPVVLHRANVDFTGSTLVDPNTLGGTLSIAALGGTLSAANTLGGTLSIALLGGTLSAANTLGGTASVTTNTLTGTLSVAVNALSGTDVTDKMQEVDIILNEFNDATVTFQILNNGSPMNITGMTVNALFKKTRGDLDSAGTTKTYSSAGGSPAITINTPTTGSCTLAVPDADVVYPNMTFYRIDVVNGTVTTTAIFGTVTIIQL